jgi:pyrroline-5-carboxylate reductase
VLAVVRRPDRPPPCGRSYGIGVVSAAEAAKTADTLVITVKPTGHDGTAHRDSPARPADRLIISVAAGITTARIEDSGAPLPVSGSCRTPRCWWTRR